MKANRITKIKDSVDANTMWSDKFAKNISVASRNTSKWSRGSFLAPGEVSRDEGSFRDCRELNRFKRQRLPFSLCTWYTILRGLKLNKSEQQVSGVKNKGVR